MTTTEQIFILAEALEKFRQLPPATQRAIKDIEVWDDERIKNQKPDVDSSRLAGKGEKQ